MKTLVKSQESRFQKFNPEVLDLLKSEKKGPKETQLYEHQIDALLATVSFFKETNRNMGLIQVPTGGGKSGIIALLPYVLGSHQVMVLSPSNIISKQLNVTFGGPDPDQSFYSTLNFETKDDIQRFLTRPFMVYSAKKIKNIIGELLVIVNAQKFSKSANPDIILNGNHETISQNTFEGFDTIIVDEAHHYPAETWHKIIKIFNKDGKKIIFLTATPRPETDFVTMKVPIVPVIFEISRKKLEELRIIRKIEFEPLHFETINNVSDDELAELASKIKATLEKHDDKVKNVVHKAMVLVRSDKDYTKEIVDRLNKIPELNFKAVFCTSDQPSKKHLKEFKETDDKRIMVVCKRLTEGYDNSNVSVCAILRNIGSDILFSQFVGRCIRVSKNQEADVTAKVYGPKQMWDRYDKNATSDPEDLADSEDPENMNEDDN
uniref:Helicase C-terminal domain-containing protein n=2 Tax=Panagrolaimus sp. JU765 TaxID=591449 RepID=A0AC34QS19_9BILA